MKWRLVAHPEDELDVILVRDDGALRLVDVAVELANERVGRRRIIERIAGFVLGRGTVNAELRIFAGRAQSLFEELVEVCCHHEREIERRQGTNDRRRNFVHVHFFLDPPHQAVARKLVFVMPPHPFQVALIGPRKAGEIFALGREGLGKSSA